MLSDTVGFIRDLPHGLVAAFRATLEETVRADLLLHVVDSASDTREAQIEAMRDAYRAARVELGDELGAEAVSEVLGDLEREGVRLLAARRSAHLLLDAMQGKQWVPRL